MDAILEKLGIDETYTKPVKKPKTFTSVYDNVPHVEHYNYMMDLLMLPETKEGFKYLLVCVDLGDSEFDIEPIKNKEPKTILNAFKAMFKRPYIKKPYASVQTDLGSEFKGVFHKYLYDESVLHKTAVPNRHSQMSTVENLNKNIGRFLNGYMNTKEQQTGQQYKEWTDVLHTVRDLYNEHKKKKTENAHTQKYQQSVNFTALSKTEPRFSIGDVVYYVSNTPLDALGKKQPTNAFRTGDRRWNINTRKITSIVYPMGKVPYRYMLEGLDNVSFTDNELMLSENNQSTYDVKDILDKRKTKGRIEYLVYWKGYKKSDATWVSRQSLIEDGLTEYIKQYEKNKKK
jgi:hypothetical protein